LNQFIIAILAEIEAVYLIILSGMITPTLLNFQHILLGNPLAYQNLFPTFIAYDLLDFIGCF